MSKDLRAGVAGAGVFGAFHARKYASLDGVNLEAVFDPDTERAELLAGELGVRACTDLGSFLDLGLNVATVASPGFTHYEIASRALGRGWHVYVEKPLAVDVAQGRALVDAAATGGRVLACGHQERVVFRAMGLFDAPERPVRLEAVRRNIHSGRGADVSCILDLMIHDIDLALALNPSDVVSVTGRGRAPIGPHTDEAVCEITFADGMAVALEASRVAQARDRTMRVVYPSGEVKIDFLTRAFENSTPFDLNPGFADTPQGKDPLGASVSDFLAAVRGDLPRPLVTGEEALRALDTALRADAAAKA